MRLNSFELVEPVPELNQPHALAIIRHWTDVSGVGSLVLSCLETYLNAKELGELAHPGDFFDFTRYRPTLIRKEHSSESSFLILRLLMELLTAINQTVMTSFFSGF
jgi:hypothetical protein